MPKRRFKRGFTALAALALLALLAAAGLWLWLLRSGRPERDGEARLAGLSAPVEVRFDRWGVPHVTARNALDLAAALGYLHANDRFVQMELGRRMAAGRLAELFGAPLVDRDQYFRVLRLYQAAEQSFRSAGPESRALLTAYARGVNAWLAGRGGDLPPELRALVLVKHVRIEPWTPADSLAFVSLMALDLSFFQGLPEEPRFRWLTTLGLADTRDLLGPPRAPAAPEILEMAGERETGEEPETPEPAGTPGSNALAVGGSRTASGRPLLANDTHLGLAIPGTWYQALLRAPDYEVAGFTLPGLPVVVVGQNRDLAWGFTNSMLDVGDVFFEDLDESGAPRVRRGEQWVPVREELGTIRVLDGAPVTSRIRSTDRGPLLASEPDRGLPARSLAWTLYAPGDSLGAIFRLGQTHRLDQVPAALAGYVAPAQNLLVAHRDGGLLSTVAGCVPERRKGDGRFPVPGWRLDYGWDGLRPQSSNPTLLRPADDLLVSANDGALPPGYALPWLGEFDMPYRAQRIRQVLLSRKGWTPQGLAAVQTDVVSLYAREVVRLLAGTYPGNAAKAWAALRSWDGSMTLQGPSALYALVEHELGKAIFDDETERYKVPPLNTRARLLRALEGRMSPAWFDDVSTRETETRHDILERALDRAWTIGVVRWGPDVATWRYGDVHGLVLIHPMGSAPYVGRLLNRGVFPIGGSATSIEAFSGAWSGNEQPVTFGPSMRWIADTGDPDHSLAILPGGQSGHPTDEHYDDQLAPFLRGETHPVHWSEGSIGKATVSRLRLRP